MLTIKFCAGRRVILTFLAAALLSGCGAPGPRALLSGKKLIEKGRYEEAIVKLQAATTLLPTNALAWSYLGLACHQAGKASEAENAYRKALALNPDLNEVHYNRGCLWLSLNRPDDAKIDFTAFTLRQANSFDGWLKLGTAQLRLREFASAEKSFNEALRVSNAEPAALTGLGVARVQRGFPRDAVQHFTTALKAQPNYAPALLNLAIVAHDQLKDRALALQKYREYLALQPPPPNAENVKTIVRQLEQEIAPAMPRPAAPPPAQRSGTETASGKTAAPETARVAPTQRPPGTVTAAARGTPKPEPTANAPKPQPAAETTPKPTPPATTQTAPSAADTAVMETVKLAPEAVIKPAEDVTASPLAPRYAYKSPSKPSTGNHADAERAFAQGIQAQQAQRLAEAIQSYRRACQLDPAYFDAQYNLGLASAQAGNLPAALDACEKALAIRPESLDARYNFALLLKQANYPLDAAAELSKILARYPNDSRSHLALGNLCAQQLHQPALARQHYLKVLETDPRNPQAGAIRYWLADNPK